MRRGFGQSLFKCVALSLLMLTTGALSVSAADQQPAVANPVSTTQPTVDAGNYMQDIHILLNTKWPKSRRINIVCHGHSVPAGYFKTPNVSTMNAYPHLLHELICKAYPFAVTNVIVTSIGGENAISGAKRFQADVLALRPDVITIDYALNDRRPGLKPAREAWSQMITAAKAANIKVILLTPTPDQAAKMDDPNDPINLHAQQIRELASEFQVGLVDSTKIFQDYIHVGNKLESVMSQVNHPNRQGHEMVARAIADWFVVPAGVSNHPTTMPTTQP